MSLDNMLTLNKNEVLFIIEYVECENTKEINFIALKL